MKIASKIVVITSLLCSTLAFAECPPVNGFTVRPVAQMLVGDRNICTYMSSQPMAGPGMANPKRCNAQFKSMLTDPHYTMLGSCSVNNQNRCVCRVKRTMQ